MIIAPVLTFIVNGVNITVNSFMTIILNIVLTMAQMVFGIIFRPIFTLVRFITDNLFSGFSRKLQLVFLGSACYPTSCNRHPSHGVCTYKKPAYSDTVFGGRLNFNTVSMNSRVGYTAPEKNATYNSNNSDNDDNKNKNPVNISTPNPHADCENQTSRGNCNSKPECEWKNTDNFCKIQRRSTCNDASFLFGKDKQKVHPCKLQNPILGPAYQRMTSILTGSSMPLFGEPGSNDSNVHDWCSED